MRKYIAAMSDRRAFAFVMLADVLALLMFTGLMVTQAEEDSPAFNCYVSGNGVCGPGVDSFAGFVNIDPPTYPDAVTPDRTDYADGSYVLECPSYFDFRDAPNGDVVCIPV